MIGTEHEPRPSAYARAKDAIGKEYQEQRRPLSYDEVERRIKFTPGLMFAKGVTLNSVLETLETWKLLKIIDDGKYIPVDWDN